MLYLINGAPGIQSHQTMKATEPEAENEVPIAVVLGMINQLTIDVGDNLEKKNL